MHCPLRLGHLLHLSEEVLTFSDVRVGPAYTRTLTVSNPLPSAVEVTVRASNPDRYSVTPNVLVLTPGGSASLAVRLRLDKLPPARPRCRGAPAAGAHPEPLGTKDAFLLRSNFGTQRFFAVFTPWGSPSAPISMDRVEPPPSDAVPCEAPGPGAAAEPAEPAVLQQLKALEHTNQELRHEVVAAIPTHSLAMGGTPWIVGSFSSTPTGSRHCLGALHISRRGLAAWQRAARAGLQPSTRGAQF